MGVNVKRESGMVIGSNSFGGSYELPIATAETLGGVKIGNNLSIDGNGILSANESTYYFHAHVDENDVSKLVFDDNLETMYNTIKSAWNSQKNNVVLVLSNNVGVYQWNRLFLQLSYFEEVQGPNIINMWFGCIIDANMGTVYHEVFLSFSTTFDIINFYFINVDIDNNRIEQPVSLLSVDIYPDDTAISLNRTYFEVFDEVALGVPIWVINYYNTNDVVIKHKIFNVSEIICDNTNSTYSCTFSCGDGTIYTATANEGNQNVEFAITP